MRPRKPKGSTWVIVATLGEVDREMMLHAIHYGHVASRAPRRLRLARSKNIMELMGRYLHEVAVPRRLADRAAFLRAVRVAVGLSMEAERTSNVPATGRLLPLRFAPYKSVRPKRLRP